MNEDRAQLRKPMPNFFEIQGEINTDFLSNVSALV